MTQTKNVNQSNSKYKKEVLKEEFVIMIVCITGGSGMIGSHLCKLLKGNDDISEIRLLDLREPFLHDLNNNELKSNEKVRFVKGSVTEKADLKKAFQNANAVFHCASIIDFGHKPASLLRKVNIGGTQLVVETCAEENVEFLIYTSSVEAISKWGLENYDSNAPYPASLKEFSGGVYGETKSLAEQLVLDANGVKTFNGETEMKTTALRPCGVYGEGDPAVITNVIKARMDGVMAFRVGYGVMDHIYAGNAAHAHVCALDRLKEGSNKIAGKPWNILHETPVHIIDKASLFLNRFGLGTPTRTLPDRLVLCIAYFIHYALKCVPEFARPFVVLTPASCEAVMTSKKFVDKRALELLGFQELYSEQERNERTWKWLSQEWEERPGLRATSKNKTPILLLLCFVFIIIYFR